MPTYAAWVVGSMNDDVASGWGVRSRCGTATRWTPWYWYNIGYCRPTSTYIIAAAAIAKLARKSKGRVVAILEKVEAQFKQIATLQDNLSTLKAMANNLVMQLQCALQK